MEDAKSVELAVSAVFRWKVHLDKLIFFLFDQGSLFFNKEKYFKVL